MPEQAYVALSRSMGCEPDSGTLYRGIAILIRDSDSEADAERLRAQARREIDAAVAR